MPDRALCVLLVPSRGAREAGRERLEDLLTAPGAVAVEPAAIGYGATGRLPALMRDRIALGQARRMELPGHPRAIVAFEPGQYPLARALIALDLEAELWYAHDPERPPPERLARLHEAALARAALTFAPRLEGGAPVREQDRALWERMEKLRIDSGRLGSERN